MSRRPLLVIPFLIAVLTLLVVGGVRAGGFCRSEQMTDERGTTVRMTEGCFEPTVIRVRPGETVTWVNTANVPHNAVGAAGSWFAGEVEARGDRISRRFDGPGVYPYFCHVHLGMVGAVVVEEPEGAEGGPPAAAPAGSAAAAAGSPAAAPVAAASSAASPTSVPAPAVVAGSAPSPGDAPAPVVPLAAGALAIALASLALRLLRRRSRGGATDRVPGA